MELRDGTAVTLQVPSLREHVVVGRRWVNDIVTMTDKVFGMDQDPDARRAYISNQGKATMLRQYSHWIKFAEMRTSSTDQEARDEESLAGILDDLSADDTIRDAILNAVVQYAEDTTVSFIAVPTVDAREENIFLRHPHLLPIDAERTNGLLFELIKRFADRKIYQLFGPSFNEFLANPKEVCDHLEELAREALKSKSTTDQAKVEELERLAQGLTS